MVAFFQINFISLSKGRYCNGNWIIIEVRYVDKNGVFLELLKLSTYMSKP